MFENSVTRQRLTLYILSSLVGLLAGLTAVAFRYLILGLSLVFVLIPQLLGVLGWVLVPTIGGVLVAAIVVKFAPEAKGHGVPEVMVAYTLQGGKMRMRVPLLKSLASAITIGSGGSCGREGPIAQIGAGVGSAVATMLKLSKRETKTLLMCGVSSGIAATFNAPLGGTLFGIEIVAGGLMGFSIVPVILSSVVATAISTAILGSSVSFQAPLFTMGNPLELVFYLVLGIVFGPLSVIWQRGFYFIEDLFERIRVTRYALPAIGGAVTGLLALLTIYIESTLGYSGLFGIYPYYPAIMGVEYAFIDATLIGSVGIIILLIFGILKMLATSATLGSGGSGGVFAPTLFIGAAFGGALGLFFNIIFPGAIAYPLAFALVGMAALFAGTGRAPITCIVIIMEMTSDYSIILPLMIAVSASYLVASSIESESIYTLKLARRGIRIDSGRHIGALKAIKVIDVMTKTPTVLSPTMTPEDVLDIIDNTHHTKFPVIGEDGKVQGILIAEDLFHDRPPDSPEPLVKDMMNPDFLHLSPGCTMDSALHAMMKRDEGHAVIVDPLNPDVMIGYITKADVLKAYELAILKLQQQGQDVDDIQPADVIEADF